ncbi:MAG: hypothetical protein GX547_16370 [Phycisphaerae bacterium]|nr:hypothetical protein [Phycisphaerae bacterium]
MLTHESDTQDAATSAVLDLIDAAATAGDLQLLTAADAVLLTQLLSDPAFADPVGHVAALSGTPIAATAAAAGTAAKFRFRDGDGTTILSGSVGQSVAIAGVSTGAKTFSIAGDLSAVLTAGAVFRVSGSTGNDGYYTVVSATHADGTTTVTVVEAITDATVDGTLHPYDLTLDNPALVAGQTVNIPSYTYRALKA